MQTDERKAPDAAVPGGGPGDGADWQPKGALGGLLAAVAGLLLARVPVLLVRYFDTDELEHAHAAWSVFKGLVPYRDFFEHHTPWYYFLLAPFFGLFSVDASFESAHRFLIFARVLSLVMTALSALLVYRLARLGSSRMVAILAAFFFAAQPILLQRTLEIRPDVPALPFFIAALWFVKRALLDDDGAGAPPTATPRWLLAGGICLGASIMCTQKLLFAVPGALAGLALWALGAGRSRVRTRSLGVLAFLVGVGLPAFLTWVAFAAHGGGRQFIANNFLLNARWKVHSSRHLLVTLEASWPMLLFALAGAADAIRRFRRRQPGAHGDAVLLGTFGGLAAGLLVVPAAYRQYYLPPLTVACLFAARGLSFLVGRARPRARTWLLAGVTAILLAWPAVNLRNSFRDRDEVQTRRLRYVFEHTRPTDLVLDGWLGTGVFRPSPLYYFFIHSELLAMLSDADRERYLGPLERGQVRPALIALDVELLGLGARFLDFVHASYVQDDDVFFRPAHPDPARPR